MSGDESYVDSYCKAKGETKFCVFITQPLAVQRSPLLCTPGLVKFAPAVARLFCLALPGFYLVLNYVLRRIKETSVLYRVTQQVSDHG